jgi:hypothetical protein
MRGFFIVGIRDFERVSGISLLFFKIYFLTIEARAGGVAHVHIMHGDDVSVS